MMCGGSSELWDAKDLFDTLALMSNVLSAPDSVSPTCVVCGALDVPPFSARCYDADQAFERCGQSDVSGALQGWTSLYESKFSTDKVSVESSKKLSK